MAGITLIGNSIIEGSLASEFARQFFARIDTFLSGGEFLPWTSDIVSHNSLCSGHGHTLFNAGVGGDTSYDMLARYDVDMLGHPSDLDIVFATCNDAWAAKWPPGVLSESLANYTAMVDKSLAAGRQVQVATCMPVTQDDIPDFITSMNADLAALAASRGIECIDLWTAFNDPENPGRPKAGLLADEAHPTATGYTLMANTMSLTGIEVFSMPTADWWPRRGAIQNRVNGEFASFTRATSKTALSGGGMVDVLPSRVATELWGLHQTGGIGECAVIEEARTNYVLNSYGAANAGGVWGTWNVQNALGTGGTVVPTIIPGPYGATAQRLTITGGTGGGWMRFRINTAVGSFDPGDVATASLRVTAFSRTGTGNYKFGGEPLKSDLAAVGSGAFSTTPDGLPSLTASATSSALPALTSAIRYYIEVVVAQGEVAVIDFQCAQLEKGATRTSYIPTTTAAATRDLDAISDIGTWTPSDGTGLIVRSASLAPGAAIAVDEITSGTVADAMLNRVVQRVVLYSRALDAPTIAAQKAALIGGCTLPPTSRKALAIGLL